MSRGLDRRRFLDRGLRLGLGLATAAALPSVPGCSSDQPACDLGCAGDADALADRLGAPLRYERIYHRNDPVPGPAEVVAWAAGRVPVSSFKTLDASGAEIPFASVAAGEDDAHLDAVARSLDAGVTGDLVLIYFHEPEGEVGERRSDFADAFRHVRSRLDDRLSSRARRHIRWAMCLTQGPFADGSVLEYYPGDDVVDLVAVDGYNWCPDSGHGDRQRSFRSLFSAAEAFARARSKPWLITEVGTWDDPRAGWSKAEWLEAATPVAGSWRPQLEGLMWYEHADAACDWAIGQDGDALGAFRRLGERMCLGG